MFLLFLEHIVLWKNVREWGGGSGMQEVKVIKEIIMK